MKYLIFSLILLFLSAFSCKKQKTPTPDPVAIPTPTVKYYKWDEFNMGVDLSYVNQVEDYGGVYRDSGQVKDCFQILKNHGANTVRVRLWHTPTWIGNLNSGKMYYDLFGVEKTIRRAKDLGMAVNLDIHYSDRWADPGNQETPNAWKNLSLAILKDSVYNYTLSVLNYYKSKNLTPEMVQVGNETNNGMCWPIGRVLNNDFLAYAELLKSGIKAVRDFSATSSVKPKIILHEAQLQSASWWMQGIIAKGVTDFDIIGLSHYTKWSSVKTMQGVTDTIRKLVTTYGKQVMIVETGYPWTNGNADSYNNIFSAADNAPGYAISVNDQLAYLKNLTQAIINGGGSGIQYWEPAWITSRLNDSWGTGSSWDNVTLFDFSGNILAGADYMRFQYKF
jgi:arabinogalactan endo-1,4-beta-galactosidase